MVTGRQYADAILEVMKLQPRAGYIWGTAGVLWTEAKQKALNKTTDANRANSRRYGKKWIGHYVWDCSGLTYNKGLKFGLKFHHGSNSSFKSDCQAKGKLIKGMEIPVGAWVYTGTDDKKPHIGTYTGDGLVTEAAGASQGVIQTKLHGGKWKYWGLGKGITFDFIPGQTTKPKETDKKEEVKIPSTIRRGDKGETVKQLQTLLAKAGSNLVIDGIFGPGTQSAVRAFQAKNKLVVDGIVGPKTWGELLKLK